MRKLVPWIAAHAFLAASAWAAQPYVDPKFGFKIEFPDGWEIGVEDLGGGSVSGLRAAPRTLCLAVAEEQPDTKLNSQAQLDTAMREPFGVEFWRDRESGAASNAVVHSHGVRVHPSGRTIQEAVIEEPARPDRNLSTTTMTALFLTPGVGHIVLCMTGTNDFAAMKPAMAGVIESYRPTGGGILSVGDERGVTAVNLPDSAASVALRARALAVKAWKK
jgi:hypothetical protein